MFFVLSELDWLKYASFKINDPNGYGGFLYGGLTFRMNRDHQNVPPPMMLFQITWTFWLCRNIFYSRTTAPAFCEHVKDGLHILLRRGRCIAARVDLADL